METIVLSRGQGKTKYLVIKSSQTGRPIVTRNNDTVDYIKDLANHLGVQIPRPWTYDQFISNGESYQVLLDDVDLFLEYLYPSRFKAITLVDKANYTIKNKT